MKTISPIDDSVIWQGEETSAQQVAAVMQRSHQAGSSWRVTPLQERIDIVRRYSEYIGAHRPEITQLIVNETGKLPWDAAGEVNAAVAKANVSITALKQRRDTLVVDEGPPSRTIRYQPLGVTLVLGPFNFPLHLPGGQIIPALLAGNTVVMKPSEQATAVADWMAAAWKAAGLPNDVFQLIYGRVAPATAAIDSPLVKGVFLTGGRGAGQAIHRQLAGRYDVLLALELGGNNPIVISPDVSVEAAGKTVSFSAFISAGQRCTCARRAFFIKGPNTDAQIDHLVRHAKALRVGLPGDEPVAQVGPLVSADAAKKLKEPYDRLIELGCKPLVGWEPNERRANLVHPVIVDASDLGDFAREKVGEMEWFGPMLVLHRVDDFATALQRASDTTYGLAAALLGGTKEQFQEFVDGVGAGVVNWNRATTGAAGALPFGGMGHSGNHRPAGFFAIDFCGDPVASLESGSISDDDPWSIVK